MYGVQVDVLRMEKENVTLPAVSVTVWPLTIRVHVSSIGSLLFLITEMWSFLRNNVTLLSLVFSHVFGLRISPIKSDDSRIHFIKGKHV